MWERVDWPLINVGRKGQVLLDVWLLHRINEKIYRTAPTKTPVQHRQQLQLKQINSKENAGVYNTPVSGMQPTININLNHRRNSLPQAHYEYTVPKEHCPQPQLNTSSITSHSCISISVICCNFTSIICRIRGSIFWNTFECGKIFFHFLLLSCEMRKVVVQ